MSKIRDEIREWSRIYSGDYVDPADSDELSALADRIDAEMVELPRDKDGKTIRPNQTVYSKLGKEYTVLNVALCDAGWTVRCEPDFGELSEFVPDSYFPPQDLTHTSPDILGQIEKELKEFGDVSPHDNESLAEYLERTNKILVRILDVMEGEQ